MISRRRPLAWLLFVAFLFVQMANVAHACAPASVAGEEFADFSATEKSIGPMADCEEMQAATVDHGTTASPLCVDHCTHAAQASADTHVPVLHWLPAPLPVVFLVLPAIGTLVSSQAPGLERVIAPAIPILLGRFLS